MFFRNCPKCEKELFYTLKHNMVVANKKNLYCRSCSAKRFDRSGKANPFFGKKHSVKTKKKMKIERAKMDMSYMQSDEYKKIMSIKTNRKSYYECWVDKYGKEEADRRQVEKKRKNSIASSGKNNGMYGKPSPNGSGNGWSGWYKNWRFRSLKELTYVINFLEKNNIKWESAENKKFMIKYVDHAGKIRNYFPDFFLPDEKCIVECKPKSLFNSLNVQLKIKAADKFCEKNGYCFKLIDPGILLDVEIMKLYTSGSIKFINRYDIKWRQRFLNA